MPARVSTLGFCARWFVRALVSAYYTPVRIVGRGRLPPGPVLFVANHQNSLFDPVLLGVAARRPVRFLAKATLFDAPVLGSAMRALGMIPAHRAQDDAAQVRRNLEILDRAAEALAGGDSVGIFPEGKSHDLPALEAIKSGAARIAIRAVELAGGKPVCLVPVGLNFERKEGFRTALWIQIGEPLDLAEFVSGYGGNAKQAQRALTAEIETRLKRVMIHLDDPTAAPLLGDLEHLVPQPGLRSPGPLARLQLRKRVADAMNHLHAADAPRAEAAEARIVAYRDRLAAAGISPGSPIMRFRRLPLSLRMLRDGLLLALGAVPAVLGALLHTVPVAATRMLARWRNDGPTTLALARFGFGVPLLLVWYAGAWFALRSHFLPWVAWAAVIAMPFLGLLALTSWRKLRRGCAQWFAQLRLFFDSAKLHALRDEQREVRALVAGLADQFAKIQPHDPPLKPPLTWRRIGAVAVRWAVILLIAASLWIAWSHWRRSQDGVGGHGLDLRNFPHGRLAEMLDADESALRNLLASLPALDASTRALAADFTAGRRSWFAQADNDAIHQTMRRYAAHRAELLRMLWRYQNHAQVAKEPLRDRTFLCAYATACALAQMSADFLEAFAGSAEAVRKLNEAEPAWDIPAGLYASVRRSLALATNRSAFEQARRHYAKHRAHFADAPEFHAIIARAEGTMRTLAPKLLGDALAQPFRDAADEGKDVIYEIKTVVSTWMGDTKLREPVGPLITPAQVADFRGRLRPGDIIIERRNWFVSNAFLPGYWPHAALYVGTPDDVRALGLDADPRVAAHWGKFVRTDSDGHIRVIIESVSEGVTFTTLEHSVGEADSVAVLRPRLAPEQVREAIARAFSHTGKPYDFEFDFFSSDKLVCTELVWRAYDGPIRFPLKNILGTTTLPAIELVRKFAVERGTPGAQLDFVACIEGDAGKGTARFIDEARFIETLSLPGSDLLMK